GRHVYAEHEWNPEHAFVSDQADFEGGRSVDRHDQRDEAPDGEIDMAEALPRLVKHLGKGELDRFAPGQHSAQVAVRQRLEQAIDCGGALGRWHRYSPWGSVKSGRTPMPC